MSLAYDDAMKLAARAMSAEETDGVLSLLMEGTLDEARGAALLGTWATRGETGTELCAAVRFLKQRAIAVPARSPSFDLCGTGGSGLCRYNISTTVAFIAAAAGVPVAKHGNRGSQRPNGSFDLLEALDIPFDLTPQAEVELLEETGVCFLFARTHHPTVGAVAPYRKALKRRTIFNLAGPLANPAPLKHQLIGTTNPITAQHIAEALFELCTDGAFVVWGAPGIDEISVTGSTGVLHVTPQGIHAKILDTPGYPGLSYDTLPHGDAPENKQTFLRLLQGELDGPLLEMVCVNAGAAIDLWAERPPAYAGLGAQKARDLIASGAALHTFHKHRELAQRLATT